MAGIGPGSGGGGGPSSATGSGGQGSAPGGGGVNAPQNLNNIVMEYLVKKGYRKTEKALRQESAVTDEEGRPVITRAEDLGAARFRKGFELLSKWIEEGLDIYKNELRRILWPVFVHSYLALVEEMQDKERLQFYKDFHEMFLAAHDGELRTLISIVLPEHVQANSMTKQYIQHKYRLTLTSIVTSILLQFLESKEQEGGSVILGIIVDHIAIKVKASNGAEPGTLAAMMNPSFDEDLLGDEEGIPGLAKADGGPGNLLAKLRLGRPRRDDDFYLDVRGDLADLDALYPPKRNEGQTSMLAEYEDMIKKEDEPGMERATAEDVPLPPSCARDVAMEVQRVKENRDRFVIEKTKNVWSPTSVAMYTFHNTNMAVNCITISNDYYYIAVGSSDSWIRVWSLDGSPLKTNGEDEASGPTPNSRRLVGHSGPVFALSFSIGKDNRDLRYDDVTPDAKARTLISCSSDKTIRLWNLDSWSQLVTYKAHSNCVWDVKYGPFGTYFVSGSVDTTARIWAQNHIAPVRMLVGHDKDVDKVCWHPNSAYVFTASDDKTVRMWALASGDCVRVFTGHSRPITSMVASGNGKLLATGDFVGTILLWDIESGKRIKAMRGHKGPVWSVDFSSQSEVLVSGGNDGTVRVWDLALVVADAANPDKGAVGGEASAQGASQASGAAGPSGTRKKGKEPVVTPDQISAYLTKRTPVLFVKFTQHNLILAAGRNDAPEKAE
ncbi:MAG: Transcription initiation factor TFIID subunit 5 [Vezdaea aestivalis]|nr:MAG: Transcription initiation factor TFIID subunit 5 [Vezdaea aestivalis]